MQTYARVKKPCHSVSKGRFKTRESGKKNFSPLNYRMERGKVFFVGCKMNDLMRKIEDKMLNPWKPRYTHIGYRKGMRLVMYARLAGHPIDRVISDGLLKRKKKRLWFRTLRSGFYNTIHIIGLFTPNFESWWEKVRR